MNSDRIISKFGGTRPLAKLLGCPATTVQNWIDRRNIPSKRVASIVQAAIESGVELALTDFFPVEIKNKKSNKKHNSN
jgi:hypothetical protein